MVEFKLPQRMQILINSLGNHTGMSTIPHIAKGKKVDLPTLIDLDSIPSLLKMQFYERFKKVRWASFVVLFHFTDCTSY